MKIFISHQQADSQLALRISSRLKMNHQIDSYLDVIDSRLSSDGPVLADHIRIQMEKCTQLLAVVSKETQKSWWVPWEIGVATEKDYPLATYTLDPPELPSYLRKWPFLRNDNELDIYARVSKSAETRLLLERVSKTMASARSTSTRQFYTDIRASLNQ